MIGIWKNSSTGLVRASGVALSLFLTIFSLWNPPLLNELRLKSFDLLLRRLPTPLATVPVVIVDIDSKSLAEFGQWPWPRNQLADLLRIVANARPTVIGLDMLLAEPDRSSPHRLAVAAQSEDVPAEVRDYLAQLPDHDMALAEAMSSSPVPVVIGHIFSNNDLSKQKNVPRSGNFALQGEDPAPFLYSFSQVDANLELFEKAAWGSGSFNIVPDNDSIVRNLPLLVNFGERLQPSLVLSMLQAAAGIDTSVVETSKHGVQTVRVGQRRIPTNPRGELIVNFSGPAHSLPYISAADILSGKFAPAVLKAVLRNAYVVIGTSAPGLLDLQAVPTDRCFPGVELHGQALNTILTDSFLCRPEWIKGAEAIQLLATALLMVLLLPKMKAAAGALLVLATIVGTAAFSVWSFHSNHLMVDMVVPIAAAGLLFTVLTFLSYFMEENESSRLRSTFSQYLAPAVVEELVRNQDSLVLSGEERELSILFSDIRNFTSMAEKMPPNDLCAFLNEYLTSMTDAVMDRCGTVDKFIGDAVMAFWNAPLLTPNHVRLACDCALNMQEAIGLLNSSWRKRGLPTIRMGIGIHCGMARVGNMGSEQRFDYTVIGDAVNLSSRLEGLTKLYGTDILVSGAVQSALEQSGFIFRKVDTVRVQGKTEPVEVHQLLGRCEAAGRSSRNAEEMEQYGNALFLYHIGIFHDAALLFRYLAEWHPGDRLYALYEERCRQLAENPPVHWDGITDLRAK